MTEPAFPLWSRGDGPALLASRDRCTGELAFPVLAASSPLRDAHDDVAVAPVGAVYSYTVIHPGAKSGELPYALGFVDFPGPVRIFGRLQGTPRPAIGQRFRAQPDERFGYVFTAVEA